MSNERIATLEGICQQMDKRLSDIQNHLSGLDAVKVDVATVKADVTWMKPLVMRIDDRMWWLFGLIVTSILVPILFKAFKI